MRWMSAAGESTTQVLVIFVICTRNKPLRSRPSPMLLATSFAVVGLAIVLPATPLGVYLGFVPLPPQFFLILAGIVVSYLTVVETVKCWFYAKLVRTGTGKAL